MGLVCVQFCIREVLRKSIVCHLCLFKLPVSRHSATIVEIWRERSSSYCNARSTLKMVTYVFYVDLVEWNDNEARQHAGFSLSCLHPCPSQIMLIIRRPMACLISLILNCIF